MPSEVGRLSKSVRLGRSVVLRCVQAPTDLIDGSLRVGSDIANEVVQVFGRKTMVCGRLLDVVDGLSGRGA